jgi:methyl-accepting chemotaxis protein
MTTEERFERIETDMMNLQKAVGDLLQVTLSNRQAIWKLAEIQESQQRNIDKLTDIIGSLGERVNATIGSLGERVNALTDTVNTLSDTVDKLTGTVELYFDRADARFARIEERFDARFERIEANLDALIRAITAEHKNGKGQS